MHDDRDDGKHEHGNEGEDGYADGTGGHVVVGPALLFVRVDGVGARAFVRGWRD